jgi:hypothetical protein
MDTTAVLTKWTVVQLRAQLLERGLPTAGKKAELIGRLEPVLVEERQQAAQAAEQAAERRRKQSISVGIKDQAHEAPAIFKLKMTDSMEKAFTAYARQRRLAAAELVFLFDGDRVEWQATPLEVRLSAITAGSIQPNLTAR